MAELVTNFSGIFILGMAFLLYASIIAVIALLVYGLFFKRK